MQKMLLIEADSCTGCRACEAVCSASHEGSCNPARSRIRVAKWEFDGFMTPIMCQQCREAPCMNICPVKALSRDEEIGRVVIDGDVCIGCKMCVAVCPFGGMSFDHVDNKVIKCDFCDGDPMCVKFCSTKAIKYVDASEAGLTKKKEAVQNLSERMKKYKIF